VLVGAASRDDAAVYRIAPDRALVATVDFFTPIVDDPSAFGAIAAANSVSDIYAVGARPLFALGITAFPREKLDSGLLEKIVSGGATKLAEAGVPVVGGHSVDDPEPKFGYAVIGANTRSLLLAIVPVLVSVAFFLIADIDSPRFGVIRVSAQNLLSLAQEIARPAPSPGQ